MSSSSQSSSVRLSAVRAVIVAVGLTLIFVAAFVIPGHDPKPNGLGIVQVGAPAPLVEQLQAADFQVTEVSRRPAAERAVRDRDAYAAFVPGPAGRTELLIASGASAVVATRLMELARIVSRSGRL